MVNAVTDKEFSYLITKQAKRIYWLIYQYFKDHKKCLIWMTTINPLLGTYTPNDMIRIGRYKKLLNFVKGALDENKR